MSQKGELQLNSGSVSSDAHSELIAETALSTGVESTKIYRPKKAWRFYKRIALCVGLLLVLGLAIFVTTLIYLFRQMDRPFREAASAMQRPENYVPAELYLARLWQSDPALMHSDSDASPPAWIPPEIGRLQPHYFFVGGGLSVDGGGGMIDCFGYQLTPDPAGSDDATNAYTLTYRDDVGERQLDHFTIPASERLTEDEFVRLGLAELSRREAAVKSGAPNIFGDDPTSDRTRLLKQHPYMARRLGYAVPTTHAPTQP